MRVLVYSPVRLFAEGLAAFLYGIDCVDAVQVEFDLADLYARVQQFKPDLALFDVTSKEILESTQLIRARCPEVASVAVAVAEIPADVIACADAGFAAYIPRNATAREMVAIIDQTSRGGTVCDPQIARSLFCELARRHHVNSRQHTDDLLTPREIETAKMVGRGLTNKEIASELHLSVATIKNHAHSVLHKMQVSRRTQLANLLVEDPWILRSP